MRVADPAELERLLQPVRSEHADRLLEIVRERAALLRGHFQLQSGRHAAYFLRFDAIGWDRTLVFEVAKMLCDIAPIPSRRFQVVCPESAGLFLGKAVADITGRPLVVLGVDHQRRPTPRPRRGQLDRTLPVLIVNDVVTSGTSLELLLRTGDLAAGVAGVCVFAALDPAAYAVACGRVARAHLASMRWKPREPAECPACVESQPIVPAIELN